MKRFLAQTVLPMKQLGVCVALLFWFSAEAATEKKYRVKKNDTLISIAKRHGITLAKLMEFNPKLVAPNHIRSGQVLVIPDKTQPSVKSSLSADLQKKLSSIRVVPRKWKHIVIHHSATEVGNAKAMDRYHREERHMENGLAYHFVVGNGHGMADGEISIGHRWLEQINGGHLASEALNEKSIGICLVGNFDEAQPTQNQMANLDALIRYLLGRCRLKHSAVKTHQQINTIYTRCPGRHFPTKTFLQDLRRN